jgi:hypothetical protein
VSWTLPCDVVCLGLANSGRNISRSRELHCLKRNIGNLSAIQEKSRYLLRQRGNERFVGKNEAAGVADAAREVVGGLIDATRKLERQASGQAETDTKTDPFGIFRHLRPQLKFGVSVLERMAGTTRLELATSAVTDGLSTAGTRRISRLRVRLSATVGFVGQGRLVFVQRFVQRCW